MLATMERPMRMGSRLNVSIPLVKGTGMEIGRVRKASGSEVGDPADEAPRNS